MLDHGQLCRGEQITYSLVLLLGKQKLHYAAQSHVLDAHEPNWLY